jgi:hypothetical protein
LFYPTTWIISKRSASHRHGSSGKVCTYVAWKITPLTVSQGSSIHVTQENRLQDTLNYIRRDRRPRQDYVILVSGFVSEISFHIDENIDKLKILRANSLDQGGQLIIDGASTLNGTRIDEWEAKRRRQQLWFDPQVHIRVSNLDDMSLWGRSVGGLTSGQQDMLLPLLKNLNDTSNEGSCWNRWRGVIAIIAGTAAGTAKCLAGIDLSAKGVYVAFQLGKLSFHAGGGSIKLLAVAKVAAPPILIGAGVAAAIYFIPWDRFFDWLWGVLGSFWNWLRSLISGFRSLIESWQEQSEQAEKRPHSRRRRRHHRHGPMY